MIGLEFVVRLVTDGLFLFIGISAVTRFWQVRDTEHFYFAAFTLTLAISALVSEITIPGPMTIQIDGQLTGIVISALPLLLLRVGATVRRLRQWQMPLALAGFAYSTLVLLLVDWRSPNATGLFLIAGGFYAVTQLGCAELFWVESRRVSGVTRRRYQLVFAGSLMMAITVIGLAVLLFVRFDNPFGLAIYELSAALTAILYFIGFTPPGFIRRSWQTSQVADYQEKIINTLINKPADLILRHLAESSLRVIGGQDAILISYDFESLRLSLTSTSEAISLAIAPELLDGISNLQTQFDPMPRYFRQQDRTEGTALVCLMGGYGAAALYSVPVVNLPHALTVLAIPLRSGAFFVQEDLSLLKLFAGQARAILENNSLIATTQEMVEELRDETGDLEEMVIEREQALRASEDELRRRLVQTSALYRELESFSYSVSHDLRAPLRAISGFSAALAEDYASELAPEALNYIQRISANSQKMEELMNDMLKLSKLSRSDISFAEVDLTDLAVRVSHEMRATYPGHDVAFSVDPGLVALADPALAKVLLSNLLGNAWKFTQRSANPAVELSRLRIEGETVYRISDNGAGFDMTYADKLFKPFQRLHPVEEFGGNGIGLAIVQRIVNRHGGRVWAEGKPGQGARFYFTLAGRVT